VGIQTGNLFVQVIDTQGEALPGVVLTLSGPGAPQRQVTDAEGAGRFLDLSPGSYTIKAEEEGFAPNSQPVTIHPSRNTDLGITLSPAIGE
jgi:hypothetical protein